MARKQVDLSDAYEYFKEHQNCYVICFDIIGLVPINKISRVAGDLAILETAKRIDSSKDDDMLMLRIGGDEFALFTDFTDVKDAECLKDKVLAFNETPIQFEEHSIPLSLRAGIVKIEEKNLKYSELFGSMQEAILQSRDSEYK